MHNYEHERRVEREQELRVHRVCSIREESAERAGAQNAPKQRRAGSQRERKSKNV